MRLTAERGLRRTRRVTLFYRMYDGFDVLERWAVRIRSRGRCLCRPHRYRGQPVLRHRRAGGHRRSGQPVGNGTNLRGQGMCHLSRGPFVSAGQAAPDATADVRRNWPFCSTMPPLAALPTVSAAARAFVRTALRAWHLEALTEDAELVVSELVSNAVAASTDAHGHPVYAGGCVPVIRVCLLTDGARVLVEVCDQAPGVPQVREAAADDESGRGLVLVDAISRKWGWCPATGRQGKIVWAEVSR